MKKWELLNKNKVNSIEAIVHALLSNRNIIDSETFFNPIDPKDINIEELGITKVAVKDSIKRIDQARKNKEKVIIYGDYDADGITATAILWEALHDYGLDVLPHIPDRFEEGYGINAQSVSNLKFKISNLKLIVTVDNGIVAYDGVKKATELGIDVIVIDHHTLGPKKLKACCIIHSTLTSGSGLAWFFAKELGKSSALELAAIGTIADQLPLTGINRSIVKYGIADLNRTKRAGLLALFKESGITNQIGQTKSIGTYEIGYIVAPRINAMGRLKHGLESLRLLCTKDYKKAEDIAKNIRETNLDRQKIVEEVVILARKSVTDQKVIVIAGDGYHEGVIGLAAGRLVEEFYRPAIVLSIKGEMSKASARSVSGFNIIEAIRAVGLHFEGGGHPMAAGFSIETNKIKQFERAINKHASELLTGELLQKKLKIDCEINFNSVGYDLYNKLTEFEPIGLGNMAPTFVTKNVEIIESKLVGSTKKHFKLKLKQDGQLFDSIYFGGGEIYSDLPLHSKIDVVYTVDNNSWNGYSNLQLKIKDVNLPS